MDLYFCNRNTGHPPTSVESAKSLHVAMP
jgi:hypothetical protein